MLPLRLLYDCEYSDATSSRISVMRKAECRSVMSEGGGTLGSVERAVIERLLALLSKEDGDKLLPCMSSCVEWVPHSEKLRESFSLGELLGLKVIWWPICVALYPPLFLWMQRAETQTAKRSRMIKSAAKKVDVAMIMGVWMEEGGEESEDVVVVVAERVVDWGVVGEGPTGRIGRQKLAKIL